MMNVDNKVSCRNLFKKLNILPLHSQYILTLLLFVVKNINEFKHNFDVHSINTCHRADLFPPTTTLSKYHKGVYYSGIKIFNHLPQHIKHLSCNIKKFKAALKKFLLLGSFYTLDEYYDWNPMSYLGTLI